ncbi:Polynucleotidyl transferase, ribonuclease H-like superfamily protein, putative isoform 1 [Hibiscus syriacus]|uniref:Polynucleotidyl transferase, ribonuclease H-like superfamily protein, putative isoform 1 n=1 Tax=Hibiscus syriacus TaxID=106335 RepID=A0A6A3BTG0_HIBSY|nr:uncharacterized protein LOC120210155 [Hibiscus syriacus]KAE8720106.1 Polynucleotidyl transferase, ribonuclease H-like superfamily protein, putative isoform 1 [Hibiscus syriacus]
MATVSAFSIPSRLISKTHFKSPENLSFYPNSILFQTKLCSFSSNSISLSSRKTKTLYGTWKLKSAEEGETSVSQQEDPVVAEQQDSVSVLVSPSDTLRMYFQADGMLNEAEIPKVTKALEGAEGVSNLKVQVLEGIGTVELMKQTTVQATGVASNLVEIIQGAGFKLQRLNLSFDDEEDILV